MIVTVTPSPAVNRVYWVDRLKVGLSQREEFLTRAERSATSAGGKGISVSLVLAHLGMENVAMGFVGGHTGDLLLHELRGEGVTTNFTWTREETRTNVTVLERGREHIPVQINAPGPEVSEREVDRFLRRYRRMLLRAVWVVLGGSLPQGVGPQFYQTLTDEARRAGVKVALIASGEPLLSALSARPNLVKPDTRESPTLNGIDLTTREGILRAGREIVGQGVDTVIISHEVTGDIVVTPEAEWIIKTQVSGTRLVELVGADAALLAGFLFRFEGGARLEEALRFGMAAAVLSAEGEARSCRDRGRIEQEMARISLERL